MEKGFIPYEESLALKELGFDEPCFDYYIPNKNQDPISKIFDNYSLGKHNSNTNTIYKNGIISRPLYQQAFRWFREKYELYSQTPSTCVEDNDRIFYNSPIYDELDNIVFESMEQYKTYEEAELKCLKKLIEIVKNK